MRWIRTASFRRGATASGRSICGRAGKELDVNVLKTVREPRGGSRALRAGAVAAAIAAASLVLTGEANAADPSATAGKQVWDKWCAPCHAPGNYPGTTALDALYRGSKPG